LNSRNACYHSVQNLLSSSLVSENRNIKIYRIIILPGVLYGCKSWLRTLGEEHTLNVFQSRVLRRIFWPKRDEGRRKWRKLHNEELNDLYSSPNIIWVIKYKNEMGRAYSAYGGEVRHIQGFGGERDHLEDPGIHWRIFRKWLWGHGLD